MTHCFMRFALLLDTTYQLSTEFARDQRCGSINFHRICEAPLPIAGERILGAGVGVKAERNVHAAPFPGREGGFVPKYILLRKAARTCF
jgi:hypothetical protein